VLRGGVQRLSGEIMDGIRATPVQNPILGLLSDRLKKAQQFAASPFGYSNPPAEILMNLLGVPAIQQTMERMAYGEPLTTGRGMTTKVRPEVAEAAMTLLPAGATAAKGAEKAAMAAGRAGERYAEKVVPQIMERGGAPASLLEAMSAQTVSPLTVYHGSPAKFSRFDPTKIGSGEGAQAFGYGHYVAQSPAVAKEYRVALSEPELFKKGRQIKTAAGSNMDTAKAWLQDSFESGASNPFEDAIAKVAAAPIKEKEGVISALQKLQSRGVQMQKGGFEYEIDLPDEQIAKMLDWDKPLSKQPKEVKDAMAKLGITVDEKKVAEYSDALLAALEGTGSANLPRQPLDMTGEQIIREIRRNPSRYFGSLQGREQTAAMINPDIGASALLRQSGIPGIRYLDQGSRGTGEGTSNFVVFPGNEDLLTILKRNGGLLD
jgi:hypothetical protein